jgi:hypothetical protein
MHMQTWTWACTVCHVTCYTCFGKQESKWYFFRTEKKFKFSPKMPPKATHVKTNNKDPCDLIPLPSDHPEWKKSMYDAVDPRLNVLVKCSNCGVFILCKRSALRTAKCRANQFHGTGTRNESTGDHAVRQFVDSSSSVGHGKQFESCNHEPGNDLSLAIGPGLMEQSVGAAPSNTVNLQSSVTQERTVGEKRDRRDTSEVLIKKSKEYYPNGALKSEVEESKQTTDKGESVSIETRELQTQVRELQHELAFYQATFQNKLESGIRRGIAAEAEREKRAHQRELDQQIAIQALTTKGARPLDVFLLAKLVELYHAFVESDGRLGFSAWLAEHNNDPFKHVQGQFETQRVTMNSSLSQRTRSRTTFSVTRCLCWPTWVSPSASSRNWGCGQERKKLARRTSRRRRRMVKSRRHSRAHSAKQVATRLQLTISQRKSRQKKFGKSVSSVLRRARSQ